MHVEVRLFATLREHLPPGHDGTSARIELPPDASIATLLDKLGIPAAKTHLVLVDGRHALRRDRRLDDGCVVSVWPPIAGG